MAISRLLPDVPTAEALAALIENTPDLNRFADERRLREARLQLARTARSRDVTLARRPASAAGRRRLGRRRGGVRAAR